MDELFRSNAFVQNCLKHALTLKSAVRSVGQKIDDFKMKTTPGLSYICQILLLIPSVFAIHYWLLLSPSSDVSVLEVPLMALRMYVVCVMASSWNFNIDILLLYYTSVFYELFIALVQESLYWMVQNEANNVCHETQVIPFGDFDDLCLTPLLVYIFIEALYFWLHVYSHYKVKSSSEHHKYCVVFVAYLTPLVCSITGIFPNFMSTVWYYVIKTRLVFVLKLAKDIMETEDKSVDVQKLNSEKGKYINLHGEEKDESKRHINHLQNRVEMDRIEENIFLNFENVYVRGVLLLFGILYFGLAFILEIFWYKTDITSIGSMYYIFEFLNNWSTSCAIGIVFMSFTGFISTYVTAVVVCFTTWEISIGDAVNINTGAVARYLLLNVLLDTGSISTTHFRLDVESFSIVTTFAVHFISLQTFEFTKHQILNIGNRGSKLTVWFYFRVLIVISFLIISPIILSFSVANSFALGPWNLFYSSGGLIFISEFSLFLAEWIMVSLMWYTDRYITSLESCIQYIPIVKQFSYILLLPFQFYGRYHISSFKTWWVFRAGNLIFNYFVLLAATLGQQKMMYDKRKKLLNKLGSLSDVSYSNKQRDYECSICFATIVNGKALPCLHTFHAECLRRWFQVRSVCPTCNLEI